MVNRSLQPMQCVGSEEGVRPRRMRRLSRNSSVDSLVPLSVFGMAVSHVPVSLAHVIRQALVGHAAKLIRLSKSAADVSLHFCCILRVLVQATAYAHIPNSSPVASDSVNGAVSLRDAS